MVVIALVLLVSLMMQGSTRALLLEFVTWVRELGIVGALLYGLVYVVATVALVPGSLLTLGAGFLYGPLWGGLLVLVFSVLGASASFLLARSWLRPWVVRKYSARKSSTQTPLLALDVRIRGEGWKIVFLLRLSPLVPFTILNYLLGLTSVTLRGYVLASAVGMMPGILLYSYMGSLMASFSDLAAGFWGAGAGEAHAAGRIVFLGGMAATLLVVVVLTRWARRALGGVASPPASLKP